MQMRDFYSQCVRRAWRGKLLHVEAVVGLLLLIAIPIAATWRPDIANLNWIPLAVFAIIFAGVLVYGLVTAPFYIANEMQNENVKLQNKLNDIAVKQNALDKLWQLRSDGISLRNDKVDSDQGLVAWKEAYERWRTAVLAEAGIVNINLKCYLERLDRTGPVPGNSHIFNPEHELLVRITSEILQRLQEYLKKSL